MARHIVLSHCALKKGTWHGTKSPSLLKLYLCIKKEMKVEEKP
jgi:hypothetical protein